MRKVKRRVRIDTRSPWVIQNFRTCQGFRRYFFGFHGGKKSENKKKEGTRLEGTIKWNAQKIQKPEYWK